jgi:hypothetical protein
MDRTRDTKGKGKGHGNGYGHELDIFNGQLTKNKSVESVKFQRIQ